MDAPFWLEFWDEIPGRFAYRYIPETGQLFTRPIPVCGSIAILSGGDLSFEKPTGIIDIGGCIADNIEEVLEIINNSTEWELHRQETW